MNNLKLVVAAISREIYLAKVLKSGLMGEQRKEFTQEATNAVMEWFMLTKTKGLSMNVNAGGKTYLFHTCDTEKADRILAILREGETNENE